MSSSPHSVSPLRVDRLFRWRGRDVSRIEGFSDAAFAFALTYLALTSVAPTNFGELGQVMTNFVPFAITFALLAMVWLDHYLYFRRYDIRNGVTIALNFVLLFVVLLYVYPLKFVFTYLTARWFGPVNGVSWREMHAGADSATAFDPMLFYSGGFAAIYLIFTLLYLYAWRQRELLGLNRVERRMTCNAIEACVIMGSFGVVSILINRLGGNSVVRGLDGMIYFGIGPAMGIHGFLRGSQVERLANAKN